MDKKGYISEIMSSGRIVSAGRVTNLSTPFMLPSCVPFSIYVRPKGQAGNIDMLLSVRLFLHGDDDFVNLPILSYDWSPLCITAIAANEDILEKFDIYWGAGLYIKKSSL